MSCCTDGNSTSVAVLEGQSGLILMTLRDEAGELVEKVALSSITLDLYRLSNGTTATINDRDEQDVLDLNGGLYFDDLQALTIIEYTCEPDGTVTETEREVSYNFSWEYTPQDTPFMRSDTGHQTEEHIANFRFTWDGGDKSIGHEVRMTVTNVRRFTPA